MRTLRSLQDLQELDLIAKTKKRNREKPITPEPTYDRSFDKEFLNLLKSQQ